MTQEAYIYYLEEIGEHFKKARKESHLTLRQVGKMTGTSYSSLSKLESGKDPNPSLKRLFKISKALDVDLKDLL